MSELNIASNKAIQTAIHLYEGINDLFKSFGIVAGGLAASLADWVFGAVFMTILLSNYTGFSSGNTKWVVGGIFSLALWGIQIVLWQTILTGKIAKIVTNRSASVSIYIVVFLGILIMKFGDDFSDIVGVYWLIKDNPMQFILGGGIYKTVLIIVFFLTWAICGFAEVFVALSINLLKDGGGGGGGGQANSNKHNGQGQHGNHGNGGGMKRRRELEEKRHGDMPFGERRGQGTQSRQQMGFQARDLNAHPLTDEELDEKIKKLGYKYDA